MTLRHGRITIIGLFASAMVLIGWLFPPGGSALFGPQVWLAGPREIIFDWSQDACAHTEEADLPVRAFRDAEGQIQMLLSHYDNFRMVGNSLNQLRVDCQPVMRSLEDPDPRHYQDRRWIASPYTYDGQHIWALVHEEYQGHRHAGRCPEHSYFRCWYNAITLAESSDGGRSYRQARSPRQLIAGAAYRYRHGVGPVGVFAPSNLVRRKNYFYALVRVRDPARPSGNCLIRSKDIARPLTWRAWSGERFDVDFSNPYRGRAKPSLGCDSISPGEISEMSESLTFNTALNRYLLVGIAGPVNRRHRRDTGVYFSASEDLIHWSPRKLIFSTPTLHTYRCGGRSPIAYPSVIDPRSRSRTFATTGRHPYLYFTQFRYRSCRQTPNRDLVRIRLNVFN